VHRSVEGIEPPRRGDADRQTVAAPITVSRIRISLRMTRKKTAVTDASRGH
jgi:hypothetical protein